LFQRVENEFRVHRARHAPADDAAGKHVDHESDVDEPTPRRDEREIGDPQLIRTRRGELPVDAIERTLGMLVRDRRPSALPAHYSASQRPCISRSTVQRPPQCLVEQGISVLLRALCPRTVLRADATGQCGSTRIT
jgi:hypothetical protein